jgi:hypothetical protein
MLMRPVLLSVGKLFAGSNIGEVCWTVVKEHRHDWPIEADARGKLADHAVLIC